MVDQLRLPGPEPWTVVFGEDVTGAAATTALLDLGVVLRIRGKSATTGDTTVKLRPSRWSQLDPDYFESRKTDDADLKIEADWAGDKHSLATSMTIDWADSRLSAAQADSALVPDLFSKTQQDFLATCATGRVNLAAVSLLPPIAATRYAKFTPTGTALELRAERWQVDPTLDFLELSVIAKPKDAAATQESLTAFATSLSLPLDNNPLNKTQRVLNHLIATVPI